jgi:radical SAM superfamily enzyme YgiQ (UPF0313 family)
MNAYKTEPETAEASAIPRSADVAPLSIVVCQSGPIGQRQMVFLMYPPIHVIHLAGYLRHHLPGARLNIVDGYAMSLEETVVEILKQEPDIVFIHGDTAQATAAYRIVDDLKNGVRHRTSPLFTVIFGEHASALPMEPFSRCGSDAVIVGDPEPAAHSVCLALANSHFDRDCLAGLDNVIYRSAANGIVTNPRTNKTLRLDDLPPAARDLIDLSAYRGTFYKKTLKETNVLAGRGCPWVCTFCGPAGRWAQDAPVFRFRSAKSLVEEIEGLQTAHGISDFMLNINTFNFNPNWSKSVCREIIDRKLKVNIKVHLRADRLTPELLDLMREAGIWLIYLGIESASDRTLKGLKKELTLAQIESALVEIHRAGLTTVAELMNCAYWEEDGKLVNEGFADAWRTLTFVRRMFRKGLIHAMYWSAMMPLPASESYQVAVRHDLLDDDVIGQWHFWFPVQRPIVRLPGVSNFTWYVIQWLGKVQQLYFILSSRLLHRSRVGFVVKRVGQLLSTTAASAFRAPIRYYSSLAAKSGSAHDRQPLS